MNPQHQQHELAKINVHELMEKVQSKRDVYNFLTQECEAYLPKMDTINIFFLKQIARGGKDIRDNHLRFVAYQEIRGQGCSSAPDRRADDRRLPQTCAAESVSFEVPP